MDGRPRWSTLAALCLLSLPGCFGEASATYRGTIRQADTVAGHEFGTRTATGVPVRDAHVVLAAGASPPPCAKLLEDPIPEADHLPPNRARTGADGTFRVTMIFGGFPGVIQTARLCVGHPDYETYEYRTVFGANSGPTHGEQPMTIRLQARSSPRR